MWGLIRRVLIGSPIPTHRLSFETLGPLAGLAVFSADALSSVAYGPEEILRVLVLAGPPGLAYTIPVAIGIAGLLAIVVISYRQTVVEYPSGGGAYVVARDNLGTLPALIAGAALLTDYVLTVAVSVAAGVAAVTSAWPLLFEHRVALGVVWIIFMAVVNLRGVRESATVFGVPVYGFVVLLLTLVAVGLGKMLWGGMQPQTTHATIPVVESLSLLLVLRAFSSGCATLTGVEAVANGVQAFRPPAGPNAARVLGILAVLLGTMVLGTTLLARELGVVPAPDETVVSQVARHVFGSGTLYYFLQITTAVILVLAANTSFAGFPRLSAFMAQDGYVPRQLSNLGDRLVYSNGILALAVLASLLIVAFAGEVHLLIPLYALGVFTAFTLSQAGMVVHWARKGNRGWRRRAVVNGIGAFTTGLVLVVVAVTKFTQGAWIICLVLPALVLVSRAIRSHYDYVAARLSLEQALLVRPKRNLTLLLVGGMHRGTLEALEYARSLGTEVRAVHVEIGGEPNPRIQKLWEQWEPEIPLVVLPSPYRNLAAPLIEYAEKVRADEGYDVVTVILPEFVVGSVWEALLHNHSALWLQILLRDVPGIAVLNLRYAL